MNPKLINNKVADIRCNISSLSNNICNTVNKKIEWKLFYNIHDQLFIELCIKLRINIGNQTYRQLYIE